MIVALLLGRNGSTGFPGKNLHPLFGQDRRVLGRPLVEYPIWTACRSPHIERLYVSTDCDGIRAVARRYPKVHLIDRPPHLCTADALGEDAYLHGYQQIKEELAREGRYIPDFIVTLFANAATFTVEQIDEGIRALREHPVYDSAVTVSRYNMFSPLRARRIGPDGLLHPFVPLEALADCNTLTCDRDSQGDAWFADVSLCVCRPRCFEDIHNGLLPQRWMGRRIYPIRNWGGCDVDYEWQIPQVEHWLLEHDIPQSMSPWEG